MTRERDQVRARELQALALRRALTDSELTEAAGLVRDLMSWDLEHAARWAYEAIRRTYVRLKAEGGREVGILRSIERTANARVMGNPLPPAAEKKDSPARQARRETRVTRSIQQSLTRLLPS